MDVLEKIPFNKNQAVVFDIDDTLIHSGTHEIITDVFNIYQYCLDKGYHIHIITARPANKMNIRLTLQQLQYLNIKNYETISFRPIFDLNVYKFKLNARKKIKDIFNQNVVMSIGDMWWDIGEYGGYGIIVKKK